MRVTLDSLVSRYDYIIDSATRFGVAACFAVRGLFRGESESRGRCEGYRVASCMELAMSSQSHPSRSSVRVTDACAGIRVSAGKRGVCQHARRVL